MPVLKAGNYAAPGEIVPRGFPAVLAKGDTRFKQGSGRLELAERIFSDTPGLAARVIVNRVWGWHFGRPLVATPAISARRATSRRIRSCSTISPRASSSTDGRSSGSTRKS